MNRIAVSIAAAAALMMSGAVQAQGYVGAGGGTTHLSADCAGLTSCDNSGRGYKVFGGYRFANRLAAELLYVDFGKATATLAAGGSVLSADIKTRAYGVGMAYFGEIAPDWRGVARLGIARVNVDVVGSAGGLGASDSQDSTAAYVGLGIGYQLMKDLWLEATVDASKSKHTGDSGSVRLVSIGLTYSF